MQVGEPLRFEDEDHIRQYVRALSSYSAIQLFSNKEADLLTSEGRRPERAEMLTSAGWGRLEPSPTRFQNSIVSRSSAELTGPPNAISASAANVPGSTNRLERRWVRTSRRTPAARAAFPASVAVECPMACACSAASFGP